MFAIISRSEPEDKSLFKFRDFWYNEIMGRKISTTKIAIFRKKEIRKTIYKNEWWFVVEDIVLALIDSSDPKQYIQRMKQRDLEIAKEWVQIVHTLEVLTEGGKQKMNCVNTEGIFRIIQLIVKIGMIKSTYLLRFK